MKLDKVVIACVFLPLMLSVTGCNTEKQSSDPKAVVTPEQKLSAFNIIKKIDYIPYAYTEDGCYARSLYMSMELAAEKIPSSSLYVFGYLEPNEKVAWGYHVAPMITDKGMPEAMVLDPSLNPEAVSVTKWVESGDRMSPDESYDFYVSQGSTYVIEDFQFIRSSGGTALAQQINSFPIISSFEEMKTFTAFDISDACSVMYRYWERVGLSETELEQKRQALIERTKVLSNRLLELGKLVGPVNHTFEKCGQIH